MSTLAVTSNDEQLLQQQLQTPHYVHPIAIRQLEELCRNPTPARIANSVLFLQSQLPLRLENHITRLQVRKPAGSQRFWSPAGSASLA